MPSQLLPLDAIPDATVPPGVDILDGGMALATFTWMREEVVQSLVALAPKGWTAETTQINFGEQAGPLVLFDRSAKALVMSPFDSFMSANAYHDRAGSSVHFGVMGRAEGVPAGHGTRTILHHGEGVNAAVFDWGRALQTYYGREQVSDFTTDYLGYYTDNGAFYYYNTEEGMNYEETVLAVVDHLSEIGLPIKYFQLDSWWYPKGADEGVVEWTALPDVFPNGLQNLYQAVGLPFLAHNRWFSPETTYATENGGEYEFLIEPENGKALPLERRFWDDLLDEARVWGLVTYEQDWLDQTYTGLDALHTDVDLAWRWLNEMHGAADARGINLQYCMALPRFALAALALPRVSQIRVSEDYLATFLNWDIGVSSMFAHALGIPAFKDTYQSSDYTVAARCSRLGGNDAETIEKCLRAFEPGLHSAISSLSAGPVAPGDAIGEMNVTRIMRCCNADGLILKPDRPATLIDAKYIREAFGNAEAGPAGVAWTTHTLYDGATPLEFGVIFWTDMTEEYLISPSASGLGNYLPLFAYRVSSEDEENVNLEARFFPEDGHLPLNANTATYYYDLWYTAPIITLSRGENLFVDIAFLGEMRKWIPVSKQRVSRFEITSNMLQVHLNGVPGEMVKFHLADGTDLTEGAYFLTELPVTFGDSGRAIIECIADPDTPDIPCSTREE
ncbi:unnamed protein product [Darwinula stevensoni]|uniref:Uncharacterized protein n=1 Tax=Darwinula stevensoni TaxID=69355 RepID=A0A7R9FQW5_9CRUS|nr:unnamed protein product [Darwinula stevensoni]CAG0900286.1 unnamed protein product [Darwinula stevensoni]